MRSDVVDRPRAVLVTGVPGSGKTTLATQLARELRVPFLARDDVRGGLLMTAGAWEPTLRHVPSGDEAVAVFLRVAELLLESGVSCVLEYVVRADRPADFERLSAIADIVVVEVYSDEPLRRVAQRNDADRLIANPAVLAATGFDSVAAHTAAVVERMSAVVPQMRTDFGVPTIRVDRSDGVELELDDLIAFVTQE